MRPDRTSPPSDRGCGMNRVVEYRNLTFESSRDGALQIWFEAQCDLDFLCAPLMTSNGRGLLFERITPQILTGWALYRTGNAKEDSKGDIVSLRPFCSGSDGALTAVERHLKALKEIERNLFQAESITNAARGGVGNRDILHDALRWFYGVRREGC